MKLKKIVLTGAAGRLGAVSGGGGGTYTPRGPTCGRSVTAHVQDSIAVVWGGITIRAVFDMPRYRREAFLLMAYERFACASAL